MMRSGFENNNQHQHHHHQQQQQLQLQLQQQQQQQHQQHQQHQQQQLLLQRPSPLYATAPSPQVYYEQPLLFGGILPYYPPGLQQEQQQQLQQQQQQQEANEFDERFFAGLGLPSAVSNNTFTNPNSSKIASAQKFNNFPPRIDIDDTSSNSVELKLMIPNIKVGAIIGVQGSTIREIRDRTSAMVKVGDRHGGPDREVIIAGTASQVQAASALIKSKLLEVEHDSQSKKSSSQDSHSYAAAVASAVANSTSGAPTTGGSSIRSQQQRKATQIEVRMLVPSEKVGALIGRGGATIKQIRAMSNCEIKIAKDDVNYMGSVDRMIIAIGEKEKIELAQQLILARLNEDPPPQSPTASTTTSTTTTNTSPQTIPVTPAVHNPSAPPLPPHVPSPPPPPPPPRALSPPPAAVAPASTNTTTNNNTSTTTVQTLIPEPNAILKNDEEELIESEEVSIPEENVGRVIGRKGATINEIRAQCNAKITIHTRGPNPSIRVISISGTQEARQAAKYLISARLF